MSQPLTRVVYEAVVTADAGREGWIHSHDGRLNMPLAKPPGMGGKVNSEGTNPEQLFAAGYAGCFHAALLANARREGIPAEGSSVTAHVRIGRVDFGGYGLSVRLEVSLPDVPTDDATRLVKLAHSACPYSRATRGNIDVEIAVANCTAPKP